MRRALHSGCSAVAEVPRPGGDGSAHDRRLVRKTDSQTGTRPGAMLKPACGAPLAGVTFTVSLFEQVPSLAVTVYYTGAGGDGRGRLAGIPLIGINTAAVAEAVSVVKLLQTTLASGPASTSSPRNG